MPWIAILKWSYHRTQKRKEHGMEHGPRNVATGLTAFGEEPGALPEGTGPSREHGEGQRHEHENTKQHTAGIDVPGPSSYATRTRVVVCRVDCCTWIRLRTERFSAGQARRPPPSSRSAHVPGSGTTRGVSPGLTGWSLACSYCSAFSRTTAPDTGVTRW